MKDIEFIIQDLLNSELSLTVPLIKTKIFANKIKNEPLHKWVTNELEGYNSENELPSYRTCQGEFKGDYINGNFKVSNAVLPIPSFDKDFDKKIRTFNLSSSVSLIEELKKKIR